MVASVEVHSWSRFIAPVDRDSVKALDTAASYSASSFCMVARRSKYGGESGAQSAHQRRKCCFHSWLVM